MKKVIKFIKWTIISLFVFSILQVLFFKFVPVPFTPLMIKRYFEYKSNDEKVSFNYKWVPMEKISSNMSWAVVASEDNLFMSHYGIDYEAIKKARKHNKKGKRIRGASTISQQTAKNVFLLPSRTYLRKGLEFYYTILIETFWSKERIMEVYLNIIETGKGVYGAEAAAQKFFKKPASKLTKSESALIAACLPSPRKRNPAKPTSYISKRKNTIIDIMNKVGKPKF